ncbi:MAG: hypothetical protein K9H16_03720 [Bacteroidales bacterium]|nr:hypothetical protein [Bacteroidales bacterium]
MLKFRLKKLVLLISLVSIILLQGCIEIVEEISVHEDASGSMALSVSAGGKNNPLMAFISQFADMSFLDEIRRNADHASQVLKLQEGISKVKFTENRRSGSMVLTFDFKDDRSLNQALYAVGGYEKTIFQPNIYRITKHKFVRKNTTGWMMKLIKQEKENIPDEAIFDLVELKSVYHLPREAERINAPENVAVSNNKQTITSSNYVSDLIDKKTNTRIKIRY